MNTSLPFTVGYSPSGVHFTYTGTAAPEISNFSVELSGNVTEGHITIYIRPGGRYNFSQKTDNAWRSTCVNSKITGEVPYFAVTQALFTLYEDTFLTHLPLTSLRAPRDYSSRGPRKSPGAKSSIPPLERMATAITCIQKVLAELKEEGEEYEIYIATSLPHPRIMRRIFETISLSELKG